MYHTTLLNSAANECQNSKNYADCYTCPLRPKSLLDPLNRSQLEDINLQKLRIEFEEEETIYKQGIPTNNIYVVSSGKVKIHGRNEFGRQIILSLHGPVELLGLSDLLNSRIHQNTAIALEKTCVCAIPVASFMTLFNHRNMSIKIASELARALNRAQRLIIGQSNKYMRSRLSDAILYMADVFGSDASTGFINVQLKRSEIAELSNMTTANAIRTLSDFKKSGMIDLNGREIRIRNFRALLRTSQDG